MPVTATWREKMEFHVDFPEGESMILTSVPARRRPADGPGPMQAVLAALAGCTGMDVVMILTKMRKEPEAFRIEVDAVRREEEPRVFTHITLRYHIDGPEVTPDAALRAVDLSQNKYCSVAAMLKPSVELDYEILLNGNVVSSG